MRNLAWSVIVLGLTGMTSTAAMAQVADHRNRTGVGGCFAGGAPDVERLGRFGRWAGDGPRPHAGAGRRPGTSAPPPKRLTLTAGADFPTAYMFRGIFQEDEGFIFQPWVDLGIALYSGEGAAQGRQRQRR